MDSVFYALEDDSNSSVNRIKNNMIVNQEKLQAIILNQKESHMPNLHTQYR